MPETIKREGTRIRFDGVFDWDELYDFMTGWLGKKKFDFYETKNVRKPGTWGYEREYEAHAEREESGYVRHNIDIRIRVYHGEDVEVIANGEKKLRTKAGMLIIDLIPSVDFDWQKTWEKGFKKKARAFFHNYLVRGYSVEQMDKIYYETYKLQTGIKELLNLESKYSAYGK